MYVHVNIQIQILPIYFHKASPLLGQKVRRRRKA